MVGMLFSGTHGISPPVLIVPGVTINSEVYQGMLRDHYFPWLLSKHAAKDLIFQEDGAPSHVSKSTNAFFAKNHPDIERMRWPSNSPDLNPLDFSLWSALQSKMPPISKDRPACLVALHAAWDQLKAESNTDKINKEFERRVFACLSADGGHFE